LAKTVNTVCLSLIKLSWILVDQLPALQVSLHVWYRHGGVCDCCMCGAVTAVHVLCCRVQMYTYYLRPVLVGHEATLTGGVAEEAAR
jgi:hypothetical protein